MICPVCAGGMPPLFTTQDYRRPHDPTRFTVHWCGACDYGQVAGDFDAAAVARFYEVSGYYQPWDSTPPAPITFLERLRVRLAWSFDRGQDLTPAEVDLPSRSEAPALCDIGCGVGRQLRLFREGGYQVTGVETNAAARAAAQGEGAVFDGTAEDLPAEVTRRTFDVVLLSHVLEHCREPARALANIRRILVPEGGTLIVEVPNNQALGLHRFHGAWPWADIPRHLHLFTARSLTRLLEAAGLTVVKTFYTGYTRQFKPEWVAVQSRIQPGPDYDRLAWKLLAETALAAPARKYDSLRVHAAASGAESRRKP